jgi:hypothetical protein
MRQVSLAGEKPFVDFAGRAGEIVPAQIFVAVLGALSLTCAEATLSMEVYFGGR